MDWHASDSDIFLRVDPGEGLVASLKELADAARLDAAAIVSGVGMLSSVELGFFDTGRDDYQATSFDGIYDLNSVLGNIVRRDGAPVPHVHVIFNDTGHATYGGHLLEATCHITMEIFLSASPLALSRVKHPGKPATQIVCRPERDD